jgi:hypothetical protein
MSVFLLIKGRLNKGFAKLFIGKFLYIAVCKSIPDKNRGFN